MEDQFGGRTDDDLFYDDDFEPVDGVTTIVSDDVPVEISSYYITPSDLIPHPADLESALAPLAAAAAAGKRKGRRRRRSRSPKQTPLPPPPPPPRGGLAHSRFADKPTEKPAQTQRQQHPEPQAPESSSTTTSQEPIHGESSSGTVAANAPAHRDKRKDGRSQGKPSKAAVDARAMSGANPRQKPTEEELTAKIEKMKLVSAEKTRKFEKAEKDEKQHAEAYARGMEEARRQRAENAERRRQNEEQRRRLEDERTKNRQRKLKAMNLKEGGWDNGKEAAGEEESRRLAHGMNGGVRGAKTSLGSGLRGSRFARDSGDGEKTATPDRTDTDMSLDERPRRGGRGGRGRGNRGEGRGARGGRGGRGGHGGAAANLTPVPGKDDFPALPEAKPEAQKEPVEGAPKPATLTPLPRFAPAIGKWDDEMEFLDDVNTTATAGKN